MSPSQRQAGCARAAQWFIVEEPLDNPFRERQAMHRLFVVKAGPNLPLGIAIYKITKEIVEHHIIDGDSHDHRRI